MALYTESDSIALVERIDELMQKADEFSADRVEPTNKKMWEIIFTVRDFVVEKTFVAGDEIYSNNLIF